MSGVVGPNGAGKSTLIRSIVGRVIPDAGRCRSSAARPVRPRARTALGWVPQELAIYPRLTCRENLDSFGRYHGLKGHRPESGHCLVPRLGGARGTRRGNRQKSFRRNEAAAEHGRRTGAPAPSRPDGRADGGRRSPIAEPDLRNDREPAGRRHVRPSIRPITSRKRSGSAIGSRSSIMGASLPWERRMNWCGTRSLRAARCWRDSRTPTKPSPSG